MPIPVEISFQRPTPWVGVYSYSNTFAGSTTAVVNFVSLFNVLASGRNLILLAVMVESFSVAASATLNQLRLRRISSASGGTLQSVINQFRLADPAEVAEVRLTSSVTATEEISMFSPNQSITAAGSTAVTRMEFRPDPAWGEFLLAENEGVSLRQEVAGDADQRINVTIVWAER